MSTAYGYQTSSGNAAAEPMHWMELQTPHSRPSTSASRPGTSASRPGTSASQMSRPRTNSAFRTPGRPDTGNSVVQDSFYGGYTGGYMLSDMGGPAAQPNTSFGKQTWNNLGEAYISHGRRAQSRTPNGTRIGSGIQHASWRPPRSATGMKPELAHIMELTDIAGLPAIDPERPRAHPQDGVQFAQTWRPPMTEHEVPPPNSATAGAGRDWMEPNLEVPYMKEGNTQHAEWREPRRFKDRVQIKEIWPATQDGQVAGTVPNVPVDQHVKAGRNRIGKRALGDKIPTDQGPKFTSNWKEKESSHWHANKGGPMKDMQGLPGLQTGSIGALEMKGAKSEQFRGRARSLGMKKLQDDYPDWQTSNISWEPKEHIQERPRHPNEELAKAIERQNAEHTTEDWDKQPKPSDRTHANDEGMVMSRKQKKGLGHTAPFLPIEGTNGWYGSKYDLGDESFKVDRVPHPDDKLADQFTGKGAYRTEKDDYQQIKDYERRGLLDRGAINLFHGPCDGMSESRAMHPGYLQEPTEATRPMSSTYALIGPMKQTPGRFVAETKLQMTEEHGGWNAQRAEPPLKLEAPNDQFLTTTRNIFTPHKDAVKEMFYVKETDVKQVEDWKYN